MVEWRDWLLDCEVTWLVTWNIVKWCDWLLERLTLWSDVIGYLRDCEVVWLVTWLWNDMIGNLIEKNCGVTWLLIRWLHRQAVGKAWRQVVTRGTMDLSTTLSSYFEWWNYFEWFRFPVHDYFDATNYLIVVKEARRGDQENIVCICGNKCVEIVHNGRFERLIIRDIHFGGRRWLTTAHDKHRVVRYLYYSSVAIHGPRLFYCKTATIRKMTDYYVDIFKRYLDRYLRMVPDEPQISVYTVLRRAESNSLFDMAQFAGAQLLSALEEPDQVSVARGSHSRPRWD